MKITISNKTKISVKANGFSIDLTSVSKLLFDTSSYFIKRLIHTIIDLLYI